MENTYKCVLCGYVYDERLGDPISGIREGTPFGKLPSNWVCPVCGASTTEFEETDK